MDFEAEINQLKDTLVVMSEIQRRQAQVQRTQAEMSAAHDKQIAQIRATLVEITDKLNGLIDVVDGSVRRPGDEPS